MFFVKILDPVVDDIVAVPIHFPVVGRKGRDDFGGFVGRLSVVRALRIYLTSDVASDQIDMIHYRGVPIIVDGRAFKLDGDHYGILFPNADL